MGKTNYQSLKELAAELTEKLDQLANGQLKVDEIEALTNQAKEVYERLVIIRYKAYEGRDEEAVIQHVSKVEVEREKVIEQPEIKDLPEAEEDMMMFDFSVSEDVGSEANAEPKEDTVEAIVNDQIETEDEAANPNKIVEDRSLNDNYTKEDGSVAKKFEKAPISDLKEHIGINRKFLYINELFGGDGNAYNAAIGQLNSCSSQEEAFEKATILKSGQGWDSENSTVIGFLELVERRYLG